jgi:hypothetical protein
VLLLAGAAAFALLLAVLVPAVASAATQPPVPTTAPSTGTSGATPDPQPGPPPVPPGQESPATPAPEGADATPAPDTAGTPPEGDGTGSGEPCPADNPNCTTTPQVPAPPVPHTTPPAPDTGGDGGGGIVGWITDAINNAITAFFRKLVTAALNPLLDLLGRTLLTTPAPSDLPAIGQLWSTSWAITVAAYGLLITAGGITVMAYGSTQTRTTVKEIAPRIPLGFLAAAFSQFLAAKAIELANPLPGAILGNGIDPANASAQLHKIIVTPLGSVNDAADSSIFVVFLDLFLAVALVALLCTYIGRIVITVVLIGSAPLALACHALPQTEKVAYWWWRAFFGVLAIQTAQAFVLIAALKVFFTPSGMSWLGLSPDGIVNLLAATTLVYFLIKIPFWMMPRIGHGGSGIVGRVVRGYLIGRALGLLGGGFGRGRGRASGRAGRGRGGGGRGRGGRGRGGRGGPGGDRPGGGQADPYDRIEVDAHGQGLIPLTRVPRVRRPRPARGVPRPPRPANPPGRSRPRHRQLSIPFGQAVAPGGRYLHRDGGAWVDRDGQLLLPFEVDQPHPPAAPQPVRRPAAGRAGAGRPRPGRPATPRPTPTGRQLELPFDPYQGIRPDRTGQYALPLEGLHRTPRPARPAPPAPPAARPSPPARPVPPRYRQLLLPNMPRRPRPPRTGR